MKTEDDPIVAEIRAVRSELTARFGSDINALCDFLVEREQEHRDLLVNYEPNPPLAIEGRQKARSN
ncbi:MAG: hypothetical protein M3P29_06510 [Acidobacteriota bacterium]|nr:hypothetical protein [Acidobacteriota bacterium]